MSRRTRKFLLSFGIAAVCLLVALLIFGETYVRGLGPRARKRVIAAISERFDADVQLRTLDLTLVPVPHVTGEDLEIKRRNHPGKLPFLRVRRLYASATVSDLFYQRDRVGEVRLEGLQIDIPRREDEAEPPHQQAQPKSPQNALHILIDTLIADGAVLQIEPKSADKDPLRFQFDKLTMHSIGPGSPLTFVTLLRNARPPGLIDSSGTFGPWVRDDLRATPVKGTYKFTNANLGVFAGISGTLSSTGSYNGQLEKIAVDGVTDVPDFALKRGGAPVHLTTTFHAFVDGANGDTLLQPVEAHFLNSNFTCRGGVEEKRPHAGKTVELQATATKARMQDILVLVSGDRSPLLDGEVRFQSDIVIPPGKQDVLNKLILHGHFGLNSGIFTSRKVQQRLGTLSDRAQGITKREEEEQPHQLVASGLTADFSVENGVADFSRLVFEVPGAAIKLQGAYNLENQKLAMKGIFRMQATLSETQSGIKHWLLMPLDPVFEKDGSGFQVPLTIGGTRTEPEIAVLALHHRFKLK